jgi:hypothetical protein|tara:strand:- start:1008 stop:1301 length:294 start_codon:yes stop_codon:yes gene_type:complete
MAIFKDINELKNCVMEWGEILPHDDYLELLKEIDNSKSYDLEDEEKQHICIKWIRYFILRNNITKNYKFRNWLIDERDNYRQLMAYIERESDWTNTD